MEDRNTCEREIPSDQTTPSPEPEINPGDPRDWGNAGRWCTFGNRMESHPEDEWQHCDEPSEPAPAGIPEPRP